MAGIVKLWRQKRSPPAEPTTSFAGKTVLVTGSNTGLGYESALMFHKLGAHHIILAVRTPSTGEEAARNIRSQSKGSGDITVLPLDMLSYDSIKSFASRISSEVPVLDIAVLNAGVTSTSATFSNYNIERTIQVNTISTILLALLLLPKLRESHQQGRDTPVLEFVSSGTHVVINWDEELRKSTSPIALLNARAQKSKDGKGSYSFNTYYASSKVFLQAAYQHIARLAASKSGEPDVIVTSVCPGMTKSNLARDFKQWWILPILWLFYYIFARSTEEGARTYVSGAALGEKGRGGFWQHDKLQPTAPLLKDAEGDKRAENIWHEIIDILRRDVPEVLELTKGA
ncbi:short chain dehydrogenase/reductase [Elsinoe ampelina]|uniref:Short chain dehydrogenase/reductase n=1 Tax=Elsinoe ampelina TaxID=302913 RepID=A0A6A6GRA5_9PEZI|nr:short chain dehydrogenase/reductase [Elsinoe ampelina]